MGLTWGDNYDGCRGGWINSSNPVPLEQRKRKRKQKRDESSEDDDDHNCVFRTVTAKFGRKKGSRRFKYVAVYAARDIKKGTELRANYPLIHDGDKLTAEAMAKEGGDGKQKADDPNCDYERSEYEDDSDGEGSDEEGSDGEGSDGEGDEEKGSDEEGAEEKGSDEEGDEEEGAEEEGSGEDKSSSDGKSSSGDKSSSNDESSGDGKSSADKESPGNEGGGEGSRDRAPWRGPLMRGGLGGRFRDNDEVEAERERRQQSSALRDVPEPTSTRRARTRGYSGRGVMPRTAREERGASSSKADEDLVSAQDDEVPESQCDPNASHSRSGGSAW